MNQQTSAPVAAQERPGRTPASFTDQLIEPLSRLRNEVDRLFVDFPFRLPEFKIGASLAAPAVEVKETGKAYKVTAELPGLEADDVEVSFEDGMLRIAGEKTEERDEDERGYRLSERRYGAFERIVDLPAAAREDKIEAKFKNGVLTVTVPKDGESERKARRIAIQKA